MKGKTVFKLAAIGGILYCLYLMQQDASLTDNADAVQEQKEQFRKQLEEDIRKAEASMAGVPNPMKILSMEEFSQKSGKALDYAEIETMDPLYYMINTAEAEKPLFGIRLTDQDGLEYDFRFVRGRGDEDISGMYYNWTTQAGYPGKKPNCKVFLNDTGQGICLWKDRSKRYSLSSGREASLEKLVCMKEKILEKQAPAAK
ncbi:MAG: hypothetical protein IKX89_05290 [Firmicutes bacterium]|nr:hypothetical protein [Bacillota bacterium]